MMEKKWEFKLNSPNIWLTADLHFSHQNVIKHCPNRAIMVFLILMILKRMMNGLLKNGIIPLKKQILSI